jgi:hypothetical protein
MLFMAGLFSCAAYCQFAPEKESGPLEAELVKPLNLRRLAVGDTVFARVTRDWDGPGCTLRQGATIEAAVELAEPHRGRGDSRLALSFSRAQCNGLELKPMDLLLAAVAQPPADWGVVPDTVFKIPMSSMNHSLNPRTGNITSGGITVDAFPLARLELHGIIHHFPMSSKVHPGAVVDIKGMTLDLGTGPNQSSVLSMKARNVELDQYTQFLLVPSSLVFVRVAVHRESHDETDDPTALTESSSESTPAANDLEVCAPPGCAVDLPVVSEELEGNTGTSIATRALGYSPRLSRNLVDFTEDDALAWLGPDQLLFTFNAHPLIRRAGGERSRAVHRIIRAVLLDAQRRSIVRAVEWEVTDSSRYLWPLSGNRVLAHVGNELRVYTAGLEVEHTAKLAGPLAFLRISPNGEVMAVATLQERHSSELHSQLADELATEPEEDVEVEVLDRDFNTIARTPTVSGLEPPTLLNEGPVVMLAQPDNHYRIALDNGSSKLVTLARFASFCRPELSSVAPDLLFLMTCNMATNRAEYRVIRADGKLLIRGEASSSELGDEATGVHAQNLFAIKSVHTSGDLTRGMTFKGEDLDFEELRVYRAADGKRMLAIRIDEPTTSHGGYALSPDGTQIAVLSGSQIQFFPLPTK